MPEIQANFASILSEAVQKKQFGIVNRGKTKFTRNYGRVLKNGKGLDAREALYELIPSEIDDIYRLDGYRILGQCMNEED